MENASWKLHGLHFSANIISVTEERKHTKFWMETPEGQDIAWKA
jgi:hypothetical protein